MRPAAATALFLSACLFASAAPAQRAPPAPPMPRRAPGPLHPPLGRIGDVVQDVPQGGVSGAEKIAVGTLDRCGRAQAFHVERFLTQGALGAAEQVQAWLEKEPTAKKRLFGAKPKADPLAEAMARARSGIFWEGRLCPKDPPLSTGPRLTAPRAPARLCKPEPAPLTHGTFWMFSRTGAAGAGGALRRTDFHGAVLLAPAAAGAPDPCLPRMSAALYDAQGRTRLLYHADWAGAAEVEVWGDGCKRLAFRFDPEADVFRPVEDAVPGCRR